MEDYKYLFKVVLVGNAGVGKTCLVRKFTQGIFPPGQSATIGVDFMIKTVKVGDDKIKVSCSSHKRNYLSLTAANMGHSRTGTISIDYSELLSLRSCNSPCL